VIFWVGLQAPVGCAVVGFVKLDADIMAPQIARGDQRRAGTAEGVENRVSQRYAIKSAGIEKPRLSRPKQTLGDYAGSIR
jgi:hypothetical protein